MDSKIFCTAWGYGKKGQLGNFIQCSKSINPVQIK